MQAAGFAPALVLDRRDGRHEVVLTARNRNRPYEQAALAEAREHHRADLLARWQGRWPDPSRVDALIARRLRSTGHSEAAVAALVTACAPGVPRIGRRAWTGYGRRAAAHAFRDEADSCWAFDRATPAMWAELEQAVKARARPDKPKPTPFPVPPFAGPVPLPPRNEAKLGTTRRRSSNGRGDPEGPGER